RTKETAGDYRYFPDPNIMPVVIDDAWFDEIQNTLPEFPEVKLARYTEEFGLPEYDAKRLCESIALCECFEDANEICGNAKDAANWMISDVMKTLNARQMTYDMLALSGKSLGKLIALVSGGKVSRPNGRKILDAMFDDASIDPESFAKENNLIISTDTGLVDKVIQEAIASDPKAVADFKGGKEKALMALFGKCMKELRGNCNPQELRTLLIEAINKTN
ncbi:MAG: Asp-tRNA(Asn)/Glu-tRNA(Gln) amidotransferase GatCAB subunit B, partial [Clostridia bacterium]|nr:Asp-tRNA(Asn)/Glu-tRNA(Gln) amidotransferase GatCAB subunit B [Clostridia bacterium]